MRGADVVRAGHFQYLAPEPDQALAHAPLGRCPGLVSVPNHARAIARYLGLQRSRLAEKEICYLRELADLLNGILHQHGPVSAAERPLSHAAPYFQAQILLLACGER